MVGSCIENAWSLDDRQGRMEGESAAMAKQWSSEAAKQQPGVVRRRF